MESDEEVDEALAAFRRRHAGELERIAEVLEDVRSGPADLAALAVAVYAVDAQALGTSPGAAERSAASP